MEEVRKHNNQETGVWIVLEDLVYDVSKFDKHPGQFDILLLNAGKDATKQFLDIHSEKAKKMREKFVIGRLKQLQPGDVNFEVENIVPESNVPRYYYLLPLFILVLYIAIAIINNR